MKKIVLLFIPLLLLLASCATSRQSNVYTIELQGNPTTGYQWVLRDKPESIVLLSSDYKSSTNAKGKVGAGGVFLFNIIAREEQSAELFFEYARPWDTENPAEKRVIKIKVDKALRISEVK